MIILTNNHNSKQLRKTIFNLHFVIVWQLDLQLPIQSVAITTNVVSSNPAHGEVYSIQHYVIKVAGDLRQVGGLL
jgi:hypothetical protein